MTLTARTADMLRQEGYHVEFTEHYNYFTKRRVDLFHFADILAIKKDNVLAVQVTSYSNHAARRKKILESDIFPLVLISGIRVQVITWRKVKNRWQPKIQELTEQDLLTDNYANDQ